MLEFWRFGTTTILTGFIWFIYLVDRLEQNLIYAKTIETKTGGATAKQKMEMKGFL